MWGEVLKQEGASKEKIAGCYRKAGKYLQYRMQKKCGARKKTIIGIGDESAIGNNYIWKQHGLFALNAECSWSI